jgi:hypothetical protein
MIPLTKEQREYLKSLEEQGKEENGGVFSFIFENYWIDQGAEIHYDYNEEAVYWCMVGEAMDEVWRLLNERKHANNEMDWIYVFIEIRNHMAIMEQKRSDIDLLAAIMGTIEKIQLKIEIQKLKTDNTGDK